MRPTFDERARPLSAERLAACDGAIALLREIADLDRDDDGLAIGERPRFARDEEQVADEIGLLDRDLGHVDVALHTIDDVLHDGPVVARLEHLIVLARAESGFQVTLRVLLGGVPVAGPQLQLGEV